MELHQLCHILPLSPKLWVIFLSSLSGKWSLTNLKIAIWGVFPCEKYTYNIICVIKHGYGRTCDDDDDDDDADDDDDDDDDDDVDVPSTHDVTHGDFHGFALRCWLTGWWINILP